jgi:hypothetical protein
MKLMVCIRWILVVAGTFLLGSCATPSPVAKATRFGEEEAADFIARYYSDQTSYALKPAMNDGAFRSICDRASLLKLAGEQPRRELAVVVLIHYQSEAREDSVKLAWMNDLKALGYRRIVFLRGNNGMQANGLATLASPQAPAAFAGR